MALKKKKGSPPPPPDSPSDPTQLAPASEQREVRDWQDRWKAADKVYAEWSKRFHCDEAEDWYEGLQLDKKVYKTGMPADTSYIINLIASTIGIRVPTLQFFRPHVRVGARPWRVDDQFSEVEERARIQEDTINSVIADPRTNYVEEAEHALLDAFFRFGILESNWSSDFIDNPNAGKPVLKGDVPLKDEDGNEVIHPKKILNPDNPNATELAYVRHIPATRFRVALHAPHLLDQADWCGYAELHYLEDLRADRDLSRTSRLTPSAKLPADIQGFDFNSDRERIGIDGELPTRRGMVLILKIWDHRTRTRFIVPADNHKFYLLKPTPYAISPFSILKLGLRVRGFYPYPPVSNWLHPQYEYNETRDRQRTHRQRFNRRFQFFKGAMEPEELTKLMTGGDGTYVEVKTPTLPAIMPIEDAALDPAVARNVAVSLNDFAQVATGGEARGIAEATTATQTNIIDARAQVKESYARQRVALWHADAARRLLQSVRAFASLPFWVQRTVDPLSPGAVDEATKVAATWQQIKAAQLGDISLDVSVDMESLSPINDVTERQDWMQMIQVLMSALPLVGASDEMLKITLRRFGFRSGREIAEIRNAVRVALATQGILQAYEQAQQLVTGLDVSQGTFPAPSQIQKFLKPGSPQFAQGSSPGPTPSNGAIQSQLDRQGQ